MQDSTRSGKLADYPCVDGGRKGLFWTHRCKVYGKATGASPTWASEVVRQCLMSANIINININNSVSRTRQVAHLNRGNYPSRAGYPRNNEQTLNIKPRDCLGRGRRKAVWPYFTSFTHIGTGFILKPNSNRQINPAASK